MGASTDTTKAGSGQKQLKERLGLMDVYAISTGAMFSSGFFLLPGLAAEEAGRAVAVAYLIAGFLVIPAMLSTAELSTAMPRPGGPFHFIDRSLGPLIGTISGLGIWIALIFKSAFALVGMSAYLSIVVDLPIQPVAVALTVAFVALNIVGTKQSTWVEIGLVAVLLATLGYFVAAGLIEVTRLGAGETVRDQFTAFPMGVEGVLAATGMVFVSYAGLAQVASISGEVKHRSRNIPLGMILSLLTAGVIYVLGIVIMVTVLEFDAFVGDLTPVATAAEEFLPLGLLLVVAAALAAFASTGNAGILAAARYPLAMARDHLLWDRFGRLGRFRTPTNSIIATGLVTVFFILALDVEGIAKVASAVILLLFGLLNIAVIVMRESQSEGYDPPFRSPFYPWTQIAGILVTAGLIFEMGWHSIFFTLGIVAVGGSWYVIYARNRVTRDGAIKDLTQRIARRLG